MPFSEAKAHLSELADKVEREHDRIVVTRNGRPSFVLLSPDDLEALEETLEILRRTPDRLTPKIREVVLAFVFDSLVFDSLAVNPRRVGKPLVGGFEGLWSARRAEYRVVHEIDDDRSVITIHRIAHRGHAHRPR